MRNWHPYIADVVRQMRADGVEEAAVLCLAPQNSRTSVGLYRRAVETSGLRIDFTEGWAQHPLLIEAFAERLRPAWTSSARRLARPFPCCSPRTACLAGPCKPPKASAADPYAEEARRTAALVAARVPEIPQWFFAFQSQGASGGPWIGPTVEETLGSHRRLGRQGRFCFSPSAFSAITSKSSTMWTFSSASLPPS